jgi:hypothetical protein
LAEVFVTISDNEFGFVEKSGAEHGYKLFQRLDSTGSIVVVDGEKFHLTRMSEFYVRSVI